MLAVWSLSARCSGMEFPTCTVEVFRVLDRIDYPRDANGNIIAMVHPNLQVKLGRLCIRPFEPVIMSCYERGNETALLNV